MLHTKIGLLRVNVPENQNRENFKKIDFLLTKHIEGYWYGMNAQFGTGYMKLSFIFEKLVLSCLLQHASELDASNPSIRLV